MASRRKRAACFDCDVALYKYINYILQMSPILFDAHRPAWEYWGQRQRHLRVRPIGTRQKHRFSLD